VTVSVLVFIPGNGHILNVEPLRPLAAVDDEAAEHADTLQARAARQQHTCNREWEMVDSAHSTDDEGRVQGDLEQRRGELGCAVIVQRRSSVKAAQCIQYD